MNKSNNVKHSKDAMGLGHQECQMMSFGFVQSECERDQSIDSDVHQIQETGSSTVFPAKKVATEYSNSKLSTRTISSAKCPLLLVVSLDQLEEADFSSYSYSLVNRDAYKQNGDNQMNFDPEESCEMVDFKWPFSGHNLKAVASHTLPKPFK